ncbi:MAG: hypothetical protein HC848_05930 [Limnobacter sp.]|nr:hypothetical protein [Limnobacter sp.]
MQSVGIVPDSLQATVHALQSLADCDVVIASGGVSVGEEDFVLAALTQVGTLESWKVAMKPGKPLAFGKIAGSQNPCWFFGLPGNPVSGVLAFLLVVKPFLDLLQGVAPAHADWRNNCQWQPIEQNWPCPDPWREEFLRARLEHGRLHLVGNQGLRYSPRWRSPRV